MKYFVLYSLLIFNTFLFAEDLKKEVKFKNLDLNELIKVSSKVLNKNILVKADIKGKVDFISVKPISKNQLLEVLKNSLESFGYELINKNSFYIINEKKEEEKEEKTEEKIEPKVITKVIALKNIEVKQLKKILQKFKSINKYEKLFISSDDESNSLILIGKVHIIKKIESLAKKLDKDEPQIFLKAKIVELNSNLVNKIGLKYGLLSGKTSNSGIFTMASNLNSNEAVDFDISSIGLSIPTLKSSISLGATLSLLHQNYALKIVSEPSILCINNKKSTIYVGQSISLKTSSTTTSGGNTSYSFERKDVGLKLEVKPKLKRDDNKVRLYINTVLEGIKNSTTNNQPDTTKKSVSTFAVVSNGESIILGGLVENRNEKLDDEVPYFSSLPIIGNLFKHKNNSSKQSNLVIVITPYIIPKNKDITFIREELAKLKRLEDLLLIKSTQNKNVHNENKYLKLHNQRVKNLLEGR
ncbi:type II secretion/transformation system, D protein [Malaciobacter marinus]|uniref:General secretion pathway protein GspD n=1 Tax=Malaciobacter marinus TaxID=505249 RepID=A0A347TH97_9BACT|nr:secretin N-terminal domain-containing protein [Malaciobacter marinus]AXX85975.1 type II secretion/transformation system, D protein [Malaciobacter marinus]PHO15925.1 general secretion pathway protein GspD [Malaciobacter marinus]